MPLPFATVLLGRRTDVLTRPWRRYDTDGTMAGLLDMERYSPEALLDPDDLAEVRAGGDLVPPWPQRRNARKVGNFGSFNARSRAL
eukprot:scaffold181443_cov33-Tisochrysis_lutea.AAC.3